jgi:sulfite reductase alpha subunit-like flavoprotein
MAGDVHNVLLKIFEECGKMAPEAAAAAVSELEHSRRYQKDVWF